ncbi:hypothetical protein SBADM41S_09440 [Streptomyces badius]
MLFTPRPGTARTAGKPMRRMLEWIDRHEPLYQTVTDYCPHGVWQCGSNPRSSEVFRTMMTEMAAPAAPSPSPTPTPPPTPTAPVPTPTDPAPSPTLTPSAQPSPPVAPTPPAPGAEPPPARRWCVTVPSVDWLGAWLREREICFRF